MQLIKLTADNLHDMCSPRSIQRADAYVGSFYACNQIDEKTIVGKIRGNHGEYEVSLTMQNDNIEQYGCGCEAAKTEICKHVAALGFTYVDSPWLFSGKRLTRSEINSLDDLKYYIATTPLKDLLVDLKAKNINISEVAGLLNVSPSQLSSIVKEDSVGRSHQLTEPIKIACLFLLEKSFTI